MLTDSQLKTAFREAFGDGDIRKATRNLTDAELTALESDPRRRMVGTGAYRRPAEHNLGFIARLIGKSYKLPSEI